MRTFKTLARKRGEKKFVEVFGEGTPSRQQRAFLKHFRRFGHPEFEEAQKVIVVRRVQPMSNADEKKERKPKAKPTTTNFASRLMGLAGFAK